MQDNNWRILTRPLIDDNPLTLQILGICSALAVTVQLKTAIVIIYPPHIILFRHPVLHNLHKGVFGNLLHLHA